MRSVGIPACREAPKGARPTVAGQRRIPTGFPNSEHLHLWRELSHSPGRRSKPGRAAWLRLRSASPTSCPLSDDNRHQAGRDDRQFPTRGNLQ
jgi:hypothetical protein